MRRALALLLLATLTAPLAAAHLQFERPTLQAGQSLRMVEASMNGTRATISLTQSADILRDHVEHVIDPAEGIIQVEHRRDTPVAAGAFRQTWRIDRLLEYRDLNDNGRYESTTDTPVKSYRLDAYQWNATPFQDVSVGGLPARYASWDGYLKDAPRIRIEVAASGKDVLDEGARGRPQDVLLYVTFTEMPTRQAGDLFTLEGAFTTPQDAIVQEFRTRNASLGLATDHTARRGFLVWGGEALLDGRERLIPPVFLGPPVANEDGTQTQPLRLDLTLFERSMRLVLVSGVEYQRAQESPGAPLAALVAAVVALALLRRR